MIRLAVRCQPEQAAAVLAELHQLAPNGVEEESGPGWIEYAIYGAEGELPDLGGVEAAAGDGLVDVRAEPIPDDWADRWRDFHEPTVIAGGRVVIRPPWCEEPQGAEVDVVVEPGQAFGTGAHPTTRMCVELLLELADRGEVAGALADLGTGSGVLAIVAAQLGFEPVSGVDSEPAALEAAQANARANGVQLKLARINLRQAPSLVLAADRQHAPPPATLVANLTAPLLVSVAARVPDGARRVVCSGLLSRERAQVERAFSRAGVHVAARRRSGEWAALLLESR